MFCSRPVVLVLGLWVLLAGFASAQEAPPPTPPEKQSWWDRFKLDYHRNKCWPEPFIAPDRAAVMTPFMIMADNGWRRQNLLSDYHFESDGTTLNSGGERRLWWIATQAPISRRMVFVQPGGNGEITAARIASLQQTLVEQTPGGPWPQVVPVNLPTTRWSGEDVDAINRQWDKTRPQPRLPEYKPSSISGGAN